MTELELENKELKACIKCMRGEAERVHDERMRLTKLFKERYSAHIEILETLHRETERADNASEECARLRDQLLAKDDRIEELEDDVLQLQVSLRLISDSAERSYRASRGDL